MAKSEMGPRAFVDYDSVKRTDRPFGVATYDKNSDLAFCALLFGTAIEVEDGDNSFVVNKKSLENFLGRNLKQKIDINQLSSKEIANKLTEIKKKFSDLQVPEKLLVHFEQQVTCLRDRMHSFLQHLQTAADIVIPEALIDKWLPTKKKEEPLTISKSEFEQMLKAAALLPEPKQMTNLEDLSNDMQVFIKAISDFCSKTKQNPGLHLDDKPIIDKIRLAEAKIAEEMKRVEEAKMLQKSKDVSKSGIPTWAAVFGWQQAPAVFTHLQQYSLTHPEQGFSPKIVQAIREGKAESYFGIVYALLREEENNWETPKVKGEQLHRKEVVRNQLKKELTKDQRNILCQLLKDKEFVAKVRSLHEGAVKKEASFKNTGRFLDELDKSSST